MSRKIVIVKHVEQEGGGLIESFFPADGWEMDIVEIERGDRFPDALDDVAGVVVMGGPMNVYQEKTYPFLKDEDRFIRTILAEEIPFLGVCLGAQLLAKACEAPVRKAPEKEVGWYTVSLTPEGRRDRLFAGVSRDLRVFQWHEDTFDIPAGGVLVADAPTCPHQAFRVGNVAYGFQFHIEATADMVRQWLQNEPGIDWARIEHDTATLATACAQESEKIILNFMRLVKSSARVRQVMRVFVDGKKKAKAEYWWNQEIRELIPEKGVA
jgi:GMP synthase-like glutamine amidotransferase